MSKIYVCDRCHSMNTSSDDVIALKIDLNGRYDGTSYVINGDFCHRCMMQIIDFCSPLPKVKNE